MEIAQSCGPQAAALKIANQRPGSFNNGVLWNYVAVLDPTMELYGLLGSFTLKSLAPQPWIQSSLSSTASLQNLYEVFAASVLDVQFPRIHFLIEAHLEEKIALSLCAREA